VPDHQCEIKRRGLGTVYVAGFPIQEELISTYGESFKNRKIKDEAEIFHSDSASLLAMRPQSRLYERFPSLPDLLPRIG
jgi:hypothetical protein